LELDPARPVDGVTFNAVMEDPNVIAFVVSALPTLSTSNAADSGMTEKVVVVSAVLPLVPSALTVTVAPAGIAVVSVKKTLCIAPGVTFPTVKAVSASAVAAPPEGM
jgi:hypothetical protein